MKTHTTKSGKTINLPSTAEDFELYASKPGAETVAGELFQAMAAIADEIDPFAVEGYAPTPKKVREFYLDRISVILDRDTATEFGSCDPEPGHHCMEALNRIASIIGGARPRS